MNKKNVKFASDVKGQMNFDMDDLEPPRESLMNQLDEFQEEPETIQKNSKIGGKPKKVVEEIDRQQVTDEEDPPEPYYSMKFAI